MESVIETMQEMGQLQRKLLSESEARPQTFPDESCSFSVAH